MKNLSKQRRALIDGDIYIYEIAAAAEEAIDWGDGLWTLHAWAEPAKARLDAKLQQLMAETDSDSLLVCLSHSKNWRKDVLPSYKENRTATRKPMLLMELRQYLIDHYPVAIYPRMEADDVLGILATHPELVDEQVVVTKDKDLNTIPCLLYFSHKPELGVVEVSEAEADHWHMVQTLTGDATDNYKGCPSIGAKRAPVLLQQGETLEEWWKIVVKAFEKAKLSEAEALVQARVARICRYQDYDYVKQEVILWEP